MTPDQSLRYARHIMLPEVGEAGQAKLLQSKVLLPRRGRARLAGRALPGGGRRRHARHRRRRRRRRVEPAAADPARDRPRRHAQGRVGAASRSRKLNPDVKVIGTRRGSTSENVLDIIKDYDVIVDGADNFPTRYLINDAALKLGKPVVARQHLPLRGAGDDVPARSTGPATAASIRSRRRPTWRRPARRRACSACCRGVIGALRGDRGDQADARASGKPLSGRGCASTRWA